MVSAMTRGVVCRTIVCSLVIAVVLLSLRSANTAYAQRIDPRAQGLLAYRLTSDVVTKLRQVMLTLDGYRRPSSDAVRPDLAVLVVLAMTGPYGGSFTDAQAQETATTLDRGHYELAAAIRRAGLTSHEYVLAWMTLLAAHPHVAAKRGGRIFDTGVAPENITFVERNWPDVDGFMSEVGQRMEQARGGR